MKSISEIIFERRTALGLSREKLAWQAKVTSKSIMTIENGGLPSMRILTKVCDALDLEVTVVDKHERALNEVEVCIIAEAIAEAAMNGENKVSVAIDYGIDVDVEISAEVNQHREDGYESGTGAWVTESCSVKVVSMNISDLKGRDIVLPNTKLLEGLAERKMMGS